MDPPTWAHNLYMLFTVNMSGQGSIDKLAIPQHSIISALWQALINVVSGVWTVELSDLGLRPQAWTHGAGVSSAMVIRRGELCARFQEVRHTQTQTQLKKPTSGWISAHFWCSLHEQRVVAALRLPGGCCYLWLRGCSCPASTVHYQWTWVDTQDCLMNETHIYRFPFHIMLVSHHVRFKI